MGMRPKAGGTLPPNDTQLRYLVAPFYYLRPSGKKKQRSFPLGIKLKKKLLFNLAYSILPC